MKKNFDIKVSVLGAGYWGTVIINTLNKLGYKNINVYDTNNRNLLILKKKFPKIIIKKNLENILKDNTLKNIFVATPPSQNYLIVKKLILNNKNIFLEKPGFINSLQIEKIKKIINKRIKLMFGYVYCYNDYIIKIKNIIKKNYLGDVQYVSLRRQNLGPIRSDVDVDYDLTSHDLSIILKLFDKIPRVISFKKYYLLNKKIADISNIHLKVKNISIDINNSWLNPTKERLIKIIGKKRMLIFDEMDLETPLKIYNQYAKYPKLDYFSKNFLKSKAYIYKGSSKNVKIVANPSLENEILYFLKSKKIETDINFGSKILSILKRI
tara:strand:- start:5646 stop:6617 length:972 start_codon:yes stop_codon:yes gene_type:complete